MRRARLAVFALAALVGPVLAGFVLGAPVLAQDAAPGYPTIERVLFVQACAREKPDRPHTEMLYKCACAIDAIAGELDYAAYVEASTAFYAGQIAGPRGTEVRESTTGRELSQRYRAVRDRAHRKCLIP